MRESQSKKVEKYRNATAENAAKNLGYSFFFEQLFLKRFRFIEYRFLHSV